MADAVPILQLALHPVNPNPAPRATFRVAFTLAGHAPAILELFDVRGRLVHQQDVGSLGSGYHEFRLSPETPLAAGMYLLRLTQAGAAVSRKAMVLN